MPGTVFAGPQQSTPRRITLDPDRITETAQFARKLYQAVLSLKPADTQPAPQVHRMARALALAELMAARTPAQY